MRYLFLGAILLFSSLAGLAQSNLSGSLRHSVYVYVYRLAPKEAEALAAHGLKKVRDRHLHTLVDSFPTGTRVPPLRTGNYLFVHTDANKMVYRLYTTDDVKIKAISNERDLSFAVHTREGQLISDARVQLNNKRLAYNAATKAYGPGRMKKKGAVKVYHNNTAYTFPLQKRWRSPFLRRALHSFPLKYLTSLFRKMGGNSYRNRSFFSDATAYEQGYKGFVAFSKPKYKPGDTVFLKAFVTTSKGKPVNRPLILRLCNDYFGTDTILATLRSYRAGGYTYQFVLSDTLDLSLDEDYLLTLEEESSRKYDLEEYDGDLGEDEYAMKRKVLVRGKFSYEEYELQSITFRARSSQETHNRGEQLSVFLKAVDKNEMPVMDGRVRILVIPKKSGNITFHTPHVFLPDTLWAHSQPLENVGETRIDLPDSIFPQASFDYEIECQFLNTNNETKEKILSQTYSNNPWHFSFELLKDSLKIDYRQSGKPVSSTGKIYVLSGNADTIEARTIQLPAIVKVNPFATSYRVSTDSVTDSYWFKRVAGMVSCLNSRTRDSVYVQLVSPNHLPVWYTIFARDKIVERGYGSTLNYRAKAITPGSYSVSLQYIFANQIQKENYTIPYQDNVLSIRTDQPESVYPGEHVKVNIHVSDKKGNAVPDADITAYGYTSKFEPSTPAVPYFGKVYPGRRWRAFQGLKEKEAEEHTASLNWQRWSHEMKLDTIEYYKFLHPQGIYVNREPAKDSITQIAPFVVDNGDLQRVHLLYIDQVPVFFSQARQLQRYSFRVAGGKHSIRLRTSDKLITLDSVWLEDGMKTFISVDVNTPDRHVRVEKMPHSLTKYEMQLWGKYMLVINNQFGEHFAYVKQNPHSVLLNTSGDQYRTPVLAGPFVNTAATLVVKNKFRQDFETEGSWEYTISQGLVRQKQYRSASILPLWLPDTAPNYDFNDFVLTEAEINELWQDYLDNRSSRVALFYNSSPGENGKGRLRIGLREAAGELFVKNVILFRNDDPDFVVIYPGITRDLGYLNPGKYRLLILLKKNNYIIKDSINVRPGGINYYEVKNIDEKAADSTSAAIAGIIERRNKNTTREVATDLDQIKETFNDKYLDPTVFTQEISGIVHDAGGMPIPFAQLTVKGTRTGGLTNAKGYFSMRVPPRCTIVASAIGYEQWEVKITENSYYTIRLHASVAKLQEVVVIGYGTTTKRYSVGNVITTQPVLQGRVAGLSIIGANGTDSTPPLVIVDGLPYNGRLEDLDKGFFASMNVLEGAAATAIYGSRAAGGVVLITTKNMAAPGAGDLQQPGNTLRRNFRDHAYWQPRLVTDVNGDASYNVTFPDDITSWRTFVIAMGDKQSGLLEQTVRSFKALSGNISVPQFAVRGDTMHVIGKTLNYLPDSITAKRTFSVNGRPYNEDTISLRNSWIDTFSVTTDRGDSLRMKYTIQRPNGYFDGEERGIPVFEPGVLATSGIFAPLYRDTSFQLQLQQDTTPIKIYAESSLLPVWYEEAENIRTYEYLCNEQLASKLKALLIQQKIDGYLKRPFKKEQQIRELIKKLGQGKSQAGLWGWWASNQPSMWISLHVTEALVAAEKSGYSIPVNKSLLTDYLVYNLESYKGTEKLSSLYLLYELGAKAAFKTYIDSIEKRLPVMSLYEQLRLAALKQQLGLPVVLDTFISRQQHTAFGNTYWGEDNYAFFNNAVQNTLCMYRMLKKASGHDDLLQKTRGYFLEQRKNGHWRNTYESSLILEAILPDVLAENPDQRPATLTIQGEERISVNEFPFSREVKSAAPLTISKQGGMPVYFTAYRRHWDEKPAKVAGNFEVSSAFEENGQTLTRLKAGTAVQLKVKVIVKADADYVMIEIPIPAGCSYQDKRQTGAYGEVHREYFKNKVSIFCNNLPKGRYEYTVSLLPRYTGTYTLNPAKVEMMYFPIFNGREAIRKVKIE